MKLQKTAVALLAMSAFAGVAHAQSSVTLYGVADGGFTYVNNVKGLHLLGAESGSEGSSRWGLSGVEDLGGGLKAIFDVESGYSLVTGTLSQNGTFFGRQAYVGLQHDDYGTVTIGRLYSVGYLAVGPMTSGGDWAASGLGYGARVGDVDNMDTSNRIANAVRYQSPIYNGLQVSGLYSFGGQAGSFGKNSVIDGAVSYNNGPVRLGFGYTRTKNPNFATFGNQAGSNSSSATSALNMPNPIYSGYSTAGAQQVIAAGGAYSFGPATIAVVYTNTQFQNLGTTTVNGLTTPKYTGNATFNSGELNVKYNVTPALMVGAAYIYTRNSGADGYSGASYNQVNLGTVYSLSKRTSLYLIGFYEKASGTDSTGTAAVAALGGSVPSSTNHQVAATAGITHKF